MVIDSLVFLWFETTIFLSSHDGLSHEAGAGWTDDEPDRPYVERVTGSLG